MVLHRSIVCDDFNLRFGISICHINQIQFWTWSGANAAAEQRKKKIKSNPKGNNTAVQIKEKISQSDH